MDARYLYLGTEIGREKITYLEDRHIHHTQWEVQKSITNDIEDTYLKQKGKTRID